MIWFTTPPPTRSNPVGYVLQIDNGPLIYHTGDTDVFNDMKLIAEFFKVDLMLSGIGGHFGMDPSRAALAVEWVNPKQVIPRCTTARSRCSPGRRRSSRRRSTSAAWAIA